MPETFTSLVKTDTETPRNIKMSVLMEPGEEETILEGGGLSVVDQMVRPSLFFIGILVFSL